MISRGKQREIVLQSLYMYEKHQNSLEINSMKEFAWQDKISVQDLDYAPLLLETVVTNLKEINNIYTSCVEKNTANVEPIDANILRIATAEICFLNIEADIAINEAIKLSKTFSTEYSFKLINGILHSIKMNAKREPHE